MAVNEEKHNVVVSRELRVSEKNLIGGGDCLVTKTGNNITILLVCDGTRSEDSA